MMDTGQVVAVVVAFVVGVVIVGVLLLRAYGRKQTRIHDTARRVHRVSDALDKIGATDE